MFRMMSLSLVLVVAATVAEAGLKIEQRQPAVQLRHAIAKAQIDPIDREIQRQARENREAIESIKRERVLQGSASK